jgi:hypothetical protein
MIDQFQSDERGAEKVYLETTIPSYLTAKPSDNLIAGARQLITQRWWETERMRFRLYVSDVVYLECSQGDSEASTRRLGVIEDIPSLGINDETINLAETLFAELGIPEKARDDALHISLACFYEIDYLLSWNFKHIVNASAIRKLRRIIERTNYRLPQICTPEELFQ